MPPPQQREPGPLRDALKKHRCCALFAGRGQTKLRPATTNGRDKARITLLLHTIWRQFKFHAFCSALPRHNRLFTVFQSRMRVRKIYDSLASRAVRGSRPSNHYFYCLQAWQSELDGSHILVGRPSGPPILSHEPRGIEAGYDTLAQA